MRSTLGFPDSFHYGNGIHWQLFHAHPDRVVDGICQGRRRGNDWDLSHSPYAKGMAGAGSALPQDAMTVYSNNAGLARLGKRFDASVELLFSGMQARD